MCLRFVSSGVSSGVAVPPVFEKIVVVLKRARASSIAMAMTMRDAGPVREGERRQPPPPRRWLELLEERGSVHNSSVERVLRSLRDTFERDGGSRVHVVDRETLHRSNVVVGADIVVSIGGDGTCLSTSRLLDENTPLLCVNSDPEVGTACSRPDGDDDDDGDQYDARRSVGMLCCCSADTFPDYMERVVRGTVVPKARSRVVCAGSVTGSTSLAITSAGG